MGLIKNYVQAILSAVYIISKVNWFTFLKLYNSESENIIFINPHSFKELIRYIRKIAFLNDLATFQHFVLNKKEFRIIRGEKNILGVREKNIYYTINRKYKIKNGKNYSESLMFLLQDLKDKKNKLFPSLESARYWENKNYMQKRFSELNIPHPKTYIVSDGKNVPKSIDLKFPVLFKPSHAAGSYGIEKLNTEQEYLIHIKNTKYQDFLIQEWIDMRSDLRLIYIGEELVVHYWRKNNSSEWRPTSTSRGSNVDFETLPSNWMKYIFEEYKKLNIPSAAFDITWRNDDLSTQPYFLEVSPAFMPNPRMPHDSNFESYVDFKKKLFIKKPYYKLHINLVFELKNKLLVLISS